MHVLHCIYEWYNPQFTACTERWIKHGTKITCNDLNKESKSTRYKQYKEFLFFCYFVLVYFKYIPHDRKGFSHNTTPAGDYFFNWCSVVHPFNRLSFSGWDAVNIISIKIVLPGEVIPKYREYYVVSAVIKITKSLTIPRMEYYILCIPRKKRVTRQQYYSLFYYVKITRCLIHSIHGYYLCRNFRKNRLLFSFEIKPFPG